MSRRLSCWLGGAVIVSVLASACAATSVVTVGSDSAAGRAAHTKAGRVINMLVTGDSYAAGNGSAGATYDVSPDDPGTPPAPYSGPGCWRKYDNASMLAYNSLGSTGLYINRACSGMKTTDVLPEVAGLPHTPTGESIDLIVYSAGGNDVHFRDIAIHCIVAPGKDQSRMYVGGRLISRNCFNLLAAMKRQIGAVIADEQANLIALHSDFPNAHIVVDGYPMLVAKVTSSGRSDWPDNTIDYAYAQLSAMMPTIAARQAAMVRQLGSWAAFNNVFGQFGGAVHNHGVYSAHPWLYGLRLNTHLAESLHPNPAGQSRIAAGIEATVNAAGWFAGFPGSRASRCRRLTSSPRARRRAASIS